MSKKKVQHSPHLYMNTDGGPKGPVLDWFYTVITEGKIINFAATYLHGSHFWPSHFFVTPCIADRTGC
jgi:hypothetical protein